MKLALIAVAAILVSTGSIPAAAESIAVVNGTPIDKKELDVTVANIVQRSGGGIQDSLELRGTLKASLITREVILQEARQRHLDKTPMFTQRLADLRNDLLREALFFDILTQTPVTDAQIKKVYDKLAASNGSKEIQARQITLQSEVDAKKVIANLKKGARFDDLLKKHSIDSNSKHSNGDMGWANITQMNPLLRTALKDIRKGQFSSTPYQSKLGWHVFKVENIRTAKLPPLDDAKSQIARQLQEEIIVKAVGDLCAKAKIQ